MDAPTKVTNLQLSIDTKEQILRFDVTMNDMLAVEVYQGVSHLVNVPSTPLLAEASVLAKLLVEFALSCELKHEENAFLVVEVAVEAENIRVS
jgi:hypothetical protein